MKHRAQEATYLASRQLLSPLDYAGVRLKPGMFERQFEQMRLFFLAIPNDSILRGFRQRAGLAAPGEALGGWYDADMPLPLMFGSRPSTLCHTFGQWLSAFARMYRVTGDESVRKKSLYLLEEWGKTIGKDGYFYYGSEPATTHYDFDKTLGGLLDIHEYIGEEAALKYAETITGWAMRNLERRRIPATPDCQSGGGWVGGHNGDVEWYTLSENLYRLYLATGRQKYRTFAEVWHYDSYWKQLMAGDAAAMTGLHAYSHVNSLSSAAMAYVVSGNVEYLRTIEEAYKILRRSQLFATGGYGPGERLAADQEGLRNSLALQKDTFETPCGTWAAFKIVRYLQVLTAKASYGDWAERLLYNGIGAALAVGEGGRTYYYADYRASGGVKKYYLDLRFPAGPVPEYTPWPCCSGTYPLAVTDYHNLIYYTDSESLYVNLYVPSEARMMIKETPVSADLDTEYPKSGRCVLTIGILKALTFKLKFRVAAWVQAPVTVQVNGQIVKVRSKPGTWVEIERTWKNGDKAVIDIPLDFRLETIGSSESDLAALMYGPVVLATGDEGPITERSPSSWLRRLSDDSLVFETIGNASRKVFRPFFDFAEGESYYLYQRMRKG